MKIAVAPPLGHGVGQLMYVGSDGLPALNGSLEPVVDVGLLGAAGVVVVAVATGNSSLARKGAVGAALLLLAKAFAP